MEKQQQREKATQIVAALKRAAYTAGLTGAVFPLAQERYMAGAWDDEVRGLFACMAACAKAAYERGTEARKEGSVGA